MLSPQFPFSSSGSSLMLFCFSRRLPSSLYVLALPALEGSYFSGICSLSHGLRGCCLAPPLVSSSLSLFSVSCVRPCQSPLIVFLWLRPCVCSSSPRLWLGRISVPSRRGPPFGLSQLSRLWLFCLCCLRRPSQFVFVLFLGWLIRLWFQTLLGLLRAVPGFLPSRMALLCLSHSYPFLRHLPVLLLSGYRLLCDPPAPLVSLH